MTYSSWLSVVFMVHPASVWRVSHRPAASPAPHVLRVFAVTAYGHAAVCWILHRAETFCGHNRDMSQLLSREPCPRDVPR